MRPKIDANAERAHIGGGLEDANWARYPGGMDGKREREPADAATDDHDYPWIASLVPAFANASLSRMRCSALP
jgi:hypothetical protein